jgi:hypothetical protein
MTQRAFAYYTGRKLDAAGQGAVGAVEREYDLRHQARDGFGDRGGARQSSNDPYQPAGRVATHLAIGTTDAGRPLTVAFIYFAETNTAYPITAWERS